jgi:hypothetical protein
MSAIHGVNYGTPTLDLNFAKNKSLIDTVTGRNLVTFTRASTGTYVGADGLIKTAAANEPRFDHNPATGESLGFLVEEARTNLRTDSTVFTTGWTWNENVTVASGQTSPTGDSTASLVTAAAGTLRARLGEKFVSSGSVVYTRSWFVKKTNQRYIWCGDQNNGSYSPNYRFDLDLGTGTVVSGSGFNSGFSITPFPDGYYRISVSCISSDIWTIIASNSSSLNPLVSAGAYTHDGTETFIIWGYQVELGSLPTSYIPTTTTTVTRSADVTSITGTNFSRFYNQSEGTISVNFNKTSTERQSPFAISDGSTTNRIGVYYLGTSVVSYIASPSGGFDQSVYTTSSPLSSKYAIGYTSGNTMPVINGALSATITETAIPTNNILFLGRTETGGTQYALNGTINRLSYYPSRLQDFQLQQITK